jgi:metal-responsive CopG/Arc/MetJ family transcriptional regulator
MRTTVDIPEDLLRAARERAARRGETLSEVVQLALKSHLEQAEQAGEERFELIVAGTPGGRYPASDEVHRLLDADEWKPPQ